MDQSVEELNRLLPTLEDWESHIAQHDLNGLECENGKYDCNNNNFYKIKKVNKDAPFSLRLTFDERARLEELAGDEPLGSYIERQVFDGKGTARKRARSKARGQ